MSDIGSGSGSTNLQGGNQSQLQLGDIANGNAWRGSPVRPDSHGAFDNLRRMHGAPLDNLSTCAAIQSLTDMGEELVNGLDGHQLGGTGAHVN